MLTPSPSDIGTGINWKQVAQRMECETSYTAAQVYYAYIISRTFPHRVTRGHPRQCKKYWTEELHKKSVKVRP